MAAQFPPTTILTATVEDVHEPAPGFRRVRLVHPALPAPTGRLADAYLKIMVPLTSAQDFSAQDPNAQHPSTQSEGLAPLNPGGIRTTAGLLALEGMLDSESVAILRQHPEHCGIMRTFTVAAAGEGWLDLDCVITGHPGPAVDWFRGAEVGDTLAIVIPAPPATTQQDGTAAQACLPGNLPTDVLPGWRSLEISRQTGRIFGVVDDTAQPAAWNVARELLPNQLLTLVVVSENEGGIALGTGFNHAQVKVSVVPTAEAAIKSLEQWLGASASQELEEPADAEDELLLWHAGRGDGFRQLFFAGESGLVRSLRRAALATGQCTKEDISFMGYWKAGAASL